MPTHPLQSSQLSMMYPASTRLAAILFTCSFVGGSALSFTALSNFTDDLSWEVQENYVPGHCGWMGEEDDINEACDIKSTAKGNLAAPSTVRPLFVKFHKVGGTTLMELINAFSGVTSNCGRSCGDCFCEGEANACTGHVSKNVFASYIKAAENDDQYRILQQAHASVDSQLVPMEVRRHLLTKLSHVRLRWHPLNNGNDDAPVVFITLLRNPVERLRSKYYFERSTNRFCLEHCPAKELTFVQYMHHMKHDPQSCCEYVNILGHGSLRHSMKVLASVFDVVGITEDMDDVYADVAKVFGVPVANLPSNVSCRDNSDNKEDWTSEQHDLAKTVVAKDLDLYHFARKLSRKRRQIT